VTTKTSPAWAQRQQPVSVRPPKPPGKATLAFRRWRAQATRVTLPYAAGLTVSLAAALAAHQPGLLWLAGGITAASAAHRAYDARGWHRKGGTAAARRRSKYQGAATRKDISQALSPRAAARHAAMACPDLHPDYAPVVIGRAVKPSRVIAGSREDSFLVIAPPRSLKTALISCWAADAPGALLATSSRTDLYAHTAIPREAAGPVWVLNPDGDGDIPTTLSWSPLDGCRNPRTAMRRAGDLMHAAPRDSSGKDAWWDAKGAELLRLMLHAAAVAGLAMADAAAWVRDPSSVWPAKALSSPAAAPGWADELAAIAASDETQLAGIIASAAAALSWMADPVMAAAADPAPGEGFDCAAFAAGSGTVYLIGEDRPHGSLAPYFAAFAAEVFEQAKQAAAANGGRLAIPMTFALDEAATICPVPLHKWTSVAAGYNVTVAAGLQALSQLTARWGEHDGATIFTNMTVKVIAGGFTDHGELERLSAVCGDVDTWDEVKAPDGGKTKQHRQERLYPPERLRQLARWHVLVLHRTTRPVEAVITPVWERRGYERAATGTGAFTLPAAQPAIEAPRREPIALPGAPAIARAPQHPALIPATPEEQPSWHATTSA
jgi:type IV secretory pathway TraG/TraD family ATPase VirD4